MRSETNDKDRSVQGIVTLLSNQGESALSRPQAKVPNYTKDWMKYFQLIRIAIMGRTAVPRRSRVRYLRMMAPSSETIEKVKIELRKYDIETRSQGVFNLVIATDKENFEKVFKTMLYEEEFPVFADFPSPPQKQYVLVGPAQIPKELMPYVDQIVLPQPVQFYQTSPGPLPEPPFHHQDVPHDIADLVNATEAQQRGWTGRGVDVAIVDSGFYNHEYYSDKGYIVRVFDSDGVEESLQDAGDSFGHGTAIASCLFAVAPEVNFRMIHGGDAPFTLQSFQAAVGMRPHVISLSFGPESPRRDEAFELEIESAVSMGICVVVACGNDGRTNTFAHLHDVISVGGVFADSSRNLSASNYASSGFSGFHPDRRFPDVCGIVGTKLSDFREEFINDQRTWFCNKGLGHIVEPTQPGNDADQGFANGTCDPDGVPAAGPIDPTRPGVFPFPSDTTGDSDGWIVSSGTSSAAPMVAGAAALLLQKDPDLEPHDIKAILQ